MAMSSSGRRTLGQWQRVLSLLREYIVLRGNLLKNASNNLLINGVSPSSKVVATGEHTSSTVYYATNISKNASMSEVAGHEPQAAAALQALTLYLHQRRARLGLPPQDGSSNEQENITDQDLLKELQDKTKEGGKNKSSKVDDSLDFIDPSAIKLRDPSAIKLRNLRYLKTVSAPVSRDSSPMTRNLKSNTMNSASPNILQNSTRLRSVSPHIANSMKSNTQIVNDNSTLSSSQSTPLKNNYTTTYSTIHIPVQQSHSYAIAVDQSSQFNSVNKESKLINSTPNIIPTVNSLSYSEDNIIFNDIHSTLSSDNSSHSKSPYAPTYSTISIPIKETSTNNNNGNHQRSLLRNFSPTYSTISIPIKQSADAGRHTTYIYNSDSNLYGTSSSGDSTSVSVSEPPESDIQKALRTVNSYIPVSLSQVNLNFLRGSKNGNDRKETARPKWMDQKRDVISKASIDSRTRHLLRGVACDSEATSLRRLADLCQHLTSFPHTKGAAIKCGGLGRVLRVLSHTKDQHVMEHARAALGLMGYAGPVSGRGARILTIDGGGVRGLVAVELLRQLESMTGQPVHKMFDFICGVSTGAIVAVLAGVHRLPLPECAELYMEMSERIFTQTRIRGTTGLVMNNSYYDSNTWDAILKEQMGEMPLMATVNAEDSPKICFIASSVERLATQAYLFRNYVLPYRVASHYNGTSHCPLWQAVRASAAAPGYFSEFQLGDLTLMDGGMLVNNPSAIAVHEARLLWPDEGFQTVVSLGTGRCQPIEQPSNGTAPSINWGDKLRTVINSATDTEGVHTILHDLMPGNVYFRFNPHLSEEITLDEIRPERVTRMMQDTQLYARQNTTKFEEAAASLMGEKNFYHKARDYVKKGRLLHGFDVEG